MSDTITSLEITLKIEFVSIWDIRKFYSVLEQAKIRLMDEKNYMCEKDKEVLIEYICELSKPFEKVNNSYVSL